MIRIGDVVHVKKPPITFSFEVVALSEKRMGAKLEPNFMKNVTSAKEYELMELNKLSGFIDRQRGTGRPTKKERRDLEQYTDNLEFDEFNFDE